MNHQVYLTDDELKRYDRHLRLPDFGLARQLKLKQAKVLLVGAGGLGCPIGLYLAASGVGIIGIADDDTIDLSNLQRQIAFSVEELGQPKTGTLCKRLNILNPQINTVDHLLRINVSNVENLIKNYDLVIDGTDNFATRFLLADACFLNKIAYLHASIYQYQGQILLFLPGENPCFRCLFRQLPQSSALPNCAEAGILGVVAGVIGLMTAVEAIKYLTGLRESLSGKLLLYNALTQESKKIVIERDENCPLCGEHAVITKIDHQKTVLVCNSIIGNMSDQNMQNIIEAKGIERARESRQMPEEKSVSVEQAAQWVKNIKDLYLLDVRETQEFEQGHIAEAALLPLSILKTLFVSSAHKAVNGSTSASRPTSGQDSEQDKYLALLPQNKEQKILCYCRRGGRSLQATDILRHAGFSNTFSMDGGFEAWQDQ